MSSSGAQWVQSVRSVYDRFFPFWHPQVQPEPAQEPQAQRLASFVDMFELPSIGRPRAGLHPDDAVPCGSLQSLSEIGVVYAALGQLDEALTWFTRAVTERSGWIAYLPRDPRLDALRTDRRFDSLFAIGKSDQQRSG